MLELIFLDVHLIELLLALLLVLFGTSVQVATGVGLGLIAAPGLLLLLDPATAIQLGIALNLLLSVTLLPFELDEIDYSSFVRLALWGGLGVPVGYLYVDFVGGSALKVTGGFIVCLASIQLMAANSAFAQKAGNTIGMRTCSLLSGAMTGALAMPGPLALWGLINQNLDATQIRAVMRAYFVFAYGLAIIIYSVQQGISKQVTDMTIALGPALLAGIVLGIGVRRFVGPDLLRNTFTIVLLVMGVVLFLDGVRYAADI